MFLDVENIVIRSLCELMRKEKLNYNFQLLHQSGKVCAFYNIFEYVAVIFLSKCNKFKKFAYTFKKDSLWKFTSVLHSYVNP